MIEATFIGMRGESATNNIDNRGARRFAEQQNKPFTRAKVREWMKCAVEPWRLYGAFRPDDMPPKGGDPVALRTLQAQFGSDYEEVDGV